MPKEPDNIVLRLLRDMRDAMASMKASIERVDKSLERVEKKQDDMHDTMITALGLAAHSNVRHEAVEKQLIDPRKRVEKLEKMT